MTPAPDAPDRSGRLSTFAAARVVARRDFVAILFSRSFFFFLLGPLFPLLIAVLASSVGARVDQSESRPQLGLAMTAADTAAMQLARDRLTERLGDELPHFVVLGTPGQRIDAAAALSARKGNVAAVLSGTPGAPVLSGPRGQIEDWAGDVAMIAAQAKAGALQPWPQVALKTTASSEARDRKGRLRTAQSAQTLLFLLTMMLAGMVLSNLVEEKGNKIIEVLAAAVPMDAVFFGKLFAMLGVSLVGIATWGAVAGTAMALTGQNLLATLPAPAVGWPLMIGLGVLYFAMAYLLLGSLFLAIGSLATTVREVQTLSMPVTMGQLLVFFLASFAMTQPGSAVEMFAVLFPLSSPFAMLARAAQDPALLPHLGALVWQVACVILLVRGGSALFRKRVMQSGPQSGRRGKRRFFRRALEAAGSPAAL